MPNTYFATLSGTKLAIQQPATGGNNIKLIKAIIYVAAATTVTLKWNATTVHSTTAGTAIPLPGTYSKALANIFTAANGSGETTGPVYNLADTSQQIIDLSEYSIPTGGATQNFSITAGGTATIQLFWTEGI